MFNLLFTALLFVRFWLLDLKPVHHDESINGWFVSQMWQAGSPAYDPTNYHGPLLFAMFHLAEALGGWGIESFRFVTVLFSVLTLIWLYRWTKENWNLEGWWLISLSLSPGFLFFSRSAIHESVFVFFTVLAATAWIDVWCLKRPARLRVFFYGLLGAALLKETFVIPLALGALASLPFLARRPLWEKIWEHRKSWSFHLAVCFGLLFFFYSDYFRHPGHFSNFFAAFLPWMKTGTAGQGHEKSFWYFWELIRDFEKATILALALAMLGLFRKGWVRGVCAWALGILLAYSVVPYKTPWCLISIQIPIWLAAGLVLAKSGVILRQGGQIAFLLIGFFSLPPWFSLNFENPVPVHPYVYVQSTKDAKIFADSLNKQALERPEIRKAKVQFGTSEAWPFPWWLSPYTTQSSQSFYEGMIPDPDLLLVDQEQEGRADAALKGEYWKRTFLVRDARVPAVAYLRKSVFTCPFADCTEVKR